MNHRKHKYITFIIIVILSLLIIIGERILAAHFKLTAYSSRVFSSDGYTYSVIQTPANPISGNLITIQTSIKMSGKNAASTSFEEAIVHAAASAPNFSGDSDPNIYASTLSNSNGIVTYGYTPKFQSKFPDDYNYWLYPTVFKSAGDGHVHGVDLDLHIAPHWLSWFVF